MIKDNARIELTSADPAGFLQLLSAKEIDVYEAQHTGILTVSFSVKNKHLRKIRSMAEKRGDTVRVISQFGYRMVVAAMQKRMVLLFWAAVLIGLTFWLPTRVLFIQVEGNTMLSATEILNAAEECGITFGASRKAIRSEKIKNKLLTLVPQLRWAGINTSGCTAVIQVREEDPASQGKEKTAGQLYAALDGVVLESTIASGYPKITVGQAVKAGQLLVSSSDPDGIQTEHRPVEAEVYAITSRKITVAVPSSIPQKQPTDDQSRKFSLLIGKKRINLNKDSGILHTGCDKMYTQWNMQLPGGFSLPFGMEARTTVAYTQTSSEQSKDDIVAFATAAAKDYLLEQMVAGRILSVQSQVESDDDFAIVTFHFQCVEMIGRLYDKEIDEEYGKDH